MRKKVIKLKPKIRTISKDIVLKLDDLIDTDMVQWYLENKHNISFDSFNDFDYNFTKVSKKSITIHCIITYKDAM